MGAVLGLARVLRAEDIARGVLQMLKQGERLRDMRTAGLATMDGRAGERIAADLAGALAEMRALKRATAGN
jgi:hypothetical protein